MRRHGRILSKAPRILKEGNMKMKDILLLGKKVIIDKSQILMEYKPDDNLKESWQVMAGEWQHKDGWLIGSERGNKGGILLSKKEYECDVMLIFTAATILPATRDVNAVYCAHWDYEINNLGESYVCGLNGWYDGKSGIERCPENGLNATTTLYKYTPGQEVRICTGAINGHSFLVADDVLITELIDPNPIRGGYVGFSPYSTQLKIKDIEIRKIYWEKREQSYEPEF